MNRRISSTEIAAARDELGLQLYCKGWYNPTCGCPISLLYFKEVVGKEKTQQVLQEATYIAGDDEAQFKRRKAYIETREAILKWSNETFGSHYAGAFVHGWDFPGRDLGFENDRATQGFEDGRACRLELLPT